MVSKSCAMRARVPSRRAASSKVENGSPAATRTALARFVGVGRVRSLLADVQG